MSSPSSSFDILESHYRNHPAHKEKMANRAYSYQGTFDAESKKVRIVLVIISAKEADDRGEGINPGILYEIGWCQKIQCSIKRYPEESAADCPDDASLPIPFLHPLLLFFGFRLDSRLFLNPCVFVIRYHSISFPLSIHEIYISIFTKRGENRLIYRPTAGSRSEGDWQMKNPVYRIRSSAKWRSGRENGVISKR